MSNILVSAATMVGAMVVANIIIQKGPALYHSIKDKYRESRQARKERHYLKKLEKQNKKMFRFRFIRIREQS